MSDSPPVQQPPQLRPVFGKQTGVPRRFGVSVGLVIMTMYAALFAVIRKADPIAFIGIALFFTGVGTAQALLFKGRNPRLASVLAGAVLLPVSGIAVGISLGNRRGVVFEPAGALCLVPFGAILGYLAGGLIGGVFLLLNKIQKPLDDESAPDGAEKGPPEPTSPWTAPPQDDTSETDR